MKTVTNIFSFYVYFIDKSTDVYNKILYTIEDRNSHDNFISGRDRIETAFSRN